MNELRSDRDQNQNQTCLPGLLRLPYEIRSEILWDVLSQGQRVCSPQYRPDVMGLSLHHAPSTDIDDRCGCCDSTTTTTTTGDPQTTSSSSIQGILFTNKHLHQECLFLLAHRATFIMHIDVRETAPSGANNFKNLYALSPSFQTQIKSLVIQVGFWNYSLPKETHFLDEFDRLMDPDACPIMFEKIVENVNEILTLLTACDKVHFSWRMYFGNTGLGWRNERYARTLIARCKKEVGTRNIKWTSQNWMGHMKFYG